MGILTIFSSVQMDKRITATLLDAVYIGVAQGQFTKNKQYRLRATKSSKGLVKVKIHNPVSEIAIYKSITDFENSWTSIIKVAECIW